MASTHDGHTGFLYDYPGYESFRLAAMNRDGWKCKNCGGYAEIVHHIKPIEGWPELAWDLDNVVSLCNSCHNRVHPGKFSPKDPTVIKGACKRYYAPAAGNRHKRKDY